MSHETVIVQLTTPCIQQQHLLAPKHINIECKLTSCGKHPVPIESLRTSLPGELRLAPHAPSPGWHSFQLSLSLVFCVDERCVHVGLSEVTPFMRPLLDHLGVNPPSESCGEFKTAMHTFTEKGYTKHHRAATYGWLSSCIMQIVDDVAEARGLSPHQVSKHCQGYCFR